MIDPADLSIKDLVAKLVDERLAELGVAANGNERLISVEEAAALVSVKPATIRDWIATGRLAEAGRAGRRIRLHAADVRRALASPPPRVRRVRPATPEQLADAALRQAAAGAPDRSRRGRGRGR